MYGKVSIIFSIFESLFCIFIFVRNVLIFVFNKLLSSQKQLFWLFVIVMAACLSSILIT